MARHRKPPNRRAPIYTAAVVAVAVFAAVLGFGGGSKGASPTAQSSAGPPSPTGPPSPGHPFSPSPGNSPNPTVSAQPTVSPTPKPSASSTGLGTSSATLGALAERARAQPVRIQIPALHVDAQVIAANVDPTGALEVPDNVVQAAWYQAGSAPGQPGTAIIAAHVNYQGQLGLFNQLHSLRPGAEISVTDAGGMVHRFRATASKLAPKSDPSTVQALAAASATPGRPRLALITCGGDLDSAKHSYYDNYVLLADI